jgi:hypothetical protein
MVLYHKCMHTRTHTKTILCIPYKINYKLLGTETTNALDKPQICAFKNIHVENIKMGGKTVA